METSISNPISTIRVNSLAGLNTNTFTDESFECSIILLKVNDPLKVDSVFNPKATTSI